MELIKEIFVFENRGYKTKKTNSVTVNILEPIPGIRLISDTMYGQGDDMVFQHPDGFKFPISRRNFGKILTNVNIENGVINAFMAIVEDSGSFSLIPGLSQEYIALRQKYDEKTEQKVNKIPLKEMSVGDKVVIARGKTIEQNYFYMGEVFILPFELKDTGYGNYLNVQVGSRSQRIRKLNASFGKKDLEKKYLFVKFSNNTVSEYFMFSSFPTVLEREIGMENINKERILDEIDTILQGKMLGFAYEGTGSYYLQTDKENVKYLNSWRLNHFIANSDKVFSLTCYSENVGYDEAYAKTIAHFGEAIII